MKILVTGSSGFIGSAVTLDLLSHGHQVIGVDNHNDYYDPSIKESRLNRYRKHPLYKHFQIDISDEVSLNKIFETDKPEKVINLAAFAGVRYSIEKPGAYIKSNIVGFANILEACRHHHIKHLVYASSSSVYGLNQKMPFSTSDNVNHPMSLYAATKKSNELMAHSYSHLYGLPTTGLRFFTAYGPWGRPDMALFKFTKAILEGSPIDLYNEGNHRRDFTYIDDIVDGIKIVLNSPPIKSLEWNASSPLPDRSSAPWRVFNIGNEKPINLMDYINIIERKLGKEAQKNYLPLQNGDVPDAIADSRELKKEFNFTPKIDIQTGISNFIDWYLEYYKV